MTTPKNLAKNLVCLWYEGGAEDAANSANANFLPFAAACEIVESGHTMA